MAIVTSRQGLADHALRALGAPVIEINVDDDQVNDRIDDALQYYQEYHFDAVVRTYLKHQLTADDITNSYISISDTVTSVVRILDLRSSSNQTLFNVEYQMRLNDMMSINSSMKGLQLYEQRRQHMALIDHRLIQQNYSDSIET
jgi:hypothetical protein